MLVLVATAPASAAGRPFDGLGRLLAPILPWLGDLPPGQSRELRIALGMEPGARPQPLRVAFGVLDLLGLATLDGPVAVVAHDVHRLDRETADVLCIVSRWLRGDPVAVLLSGRAARSAVLTGDTIEELKLGTFGSGSAAQPRCDRGARRQRVASRRGG